jgi:hypothetical protein
MNETYTGTYWFNAKEAKTGKMPPQWEWVAMRMPGIIETEMFERSGLPH